MGQRSGGARRTSLCGSSLSIPLYIHAKCIPSFRGEHGKTRDGNGATPVEQPCASIEGVTTPVAVYYHWDPSPKY